MNQKYNIIDWKTTNNLWNSFHPIAFTIVTKWPNKAIVGQVSGDINLNVISDITSICPMCITNTVEQHKFTIQGVRYK